MNKKNEIPKRLLIIDDEENMRHMLGAMLSRTGFEISYAENGADALSKVKENRFDFVLCDVRMPEVDGMGFLQLGRNYLYETTVIMMSAYGSIDLAIQAIKEGAYDFVSKPFKKDEVVLALKKAEERESLRRENKKLKRELENLKESSGDREIVGSSKPMQHVLEMVTRVAQYDTSVLISGESGTGKELIARLIHQQSPRSEKELVAINCGAIPASLIESELFGHVKGAFTGADNKKSGLFESADNGTLFLDEIAELPIEMQVKLLRVLQEGELRPVGSEVVQKVNVRIIAATAKNLSREVMEGTFRQDLLYRLNVVEIHLPALRERGEDISKLAQFFLKQFRKRMDIAVKSFSSEALALLMSYQWPGNVRELENSVEHAVVCADGEYICPEHLPLNIAGSDLGGELRDLTVSQGLSIKEGRVSLEKSLIRQALKYTGGNKSKASELLEISYPSLLQKIKQYGLPVK